MSISMVEIVNGLNFGPESTIRAQPESAAPSAELAIEFEAMLYRQMLKSASVPGAGNSSLFSGAGPWDEVIGQALAHELASSHKLGFAELMISDLDRSGRRKHGE